MYRMDDTINIVRNQNLSVDYGAANRESYNQKDLQNDIIDQYGDRLPEIFEKYFEINTRNGEYFCNSQDCQLTHLLNYSYDHSDNSRSDDVLLKVNERFSHSFRYSLNHPDKSKGTVTAEVYLVSNCTSNYIEIT